MAELKYLEGYGGQSVGQLIALEGEYRVDSIVLAFEDALRKKGAGLTSSPVGPEERVILAVEALEREVNNGGYDQFFLNSSREFVVDVVAALETIGCPKYAAITRRAIGALGTEHDMSSEAIESAALAGSDELEDLLSQCDSEFYAVADEDIAPRLFAYIKANSSRISFERASS